MMAIKGVSILPPDNINANKIRCEYCESLNSNEQSKCTSCSAPLANQADLVNYRKEYEKLQTEKMSELQRLHQDLKVQHQVDSIKSEIVKNTEILNKQNTESSGSGIAFLALFIAIMSYLFFGNLIL